MGMPVVADFVDLLSLLLVSFVFSYLISLPLSFPPFPSFLRACTLRVDVAGVSAIVVHAWRSTPGVVAYVGEMAAQLCWRLCSVGVVGSQWV